MRRGKGVLAASIGLAAMLVAGSALAQPRFKSEIGQFPRPGVDEVARGQAIAEDLNWQIDRNPIVPQGFRDLTKKHVFSGVYGRGVLTPREREMIVIGIIITQGVGSGLEFHVTDAAHRAGLTEAEFREIIYTSCFYAGWPKCGQAEKMLDAEMTRPDSSWPQAARLPAGAKPGFPTAAEELEGRALAQRLGWLDGNPLHQGFKDLTLKHIFGNVYQRGGLTLREREMLITAIILTQGVEFGLDWHSREAAHRVGVSEDEYREVIYTACFYAGWPKCGQAEKQIDTVMSRPNTWPQNLRSKNTGN